MNQLSGSIPDNLSNLHQLTYLNLSGNQFSGSIQTAWAISQVWDASTWIPIN